MTKRSLLGAVLAVALTATASAQTFKMTTPFAPGVAVPDKIESSIGTLKLDYGYPSAETVELCSFAIVAGTSKTRRMRSTRG